MPTAVTVLNRLATPRRCIHNHPCLLGLLNIQALKSLSKALDRSCTLTAATRQQQMPGEGGRTLAGELVDLG
jgi:hypothetical protein